MDPKLLSTLVSAAVSLAALAVSVVAQIESREAQALAARLERQQFESDTTIQILDRAYRELRVATETEKRLTCSYLVTLSSMEQASKETEPFFITNFLGQLARDGALVSDCIPQVEAALAVQSRRAEAVAEADAEPADAAATPARVEGAEGDEPDGYPETFGTWHALVASYSTTNCDEAQADVDEFAGLLAGSEASGRPIYVARTESTGYLAVTVDAGADEALALTIRDAIRRAAPRSSDGRTGYDSFHVGLRNWFLDPECLASATIE